MRANLGWSFEDYNVNLFMNYTGAYKNWGSPVNHIVLDANLNLGVSHHTTRVSGTTAARTASRSPRSTGVCATPQRANTFDSSRKVPPYASPARTTCEPARQTVRSSVSSAASPEAKVSPTEPCSSAASASCSAVRVGMPLRLYAEPPR